MDLKPLAPELTVLLLLQETRSQTIQRLKIKFDPDLRKHLDKDYEIFAKYFDISENGNWEGKNILIEKSITPTEEESEKIKKIKNKLLNIREKRPKPFFDDKTQMDLNAYWLSTLNFVAEIFDNEDWKSNKYTGIVHTKFP